MGMTEAVNCFAIIPAYNEASSITRCLTSLNAATLPPGFLWREWWVVDDGSEDNTADSVRAWGISNPTVPLKLVGGQPRRGKIAVVNACHKELLSVATSNDVAVFLDADIVVGGHSVGALLKEFSDPRLAAVTGLSLPVRSKFGSLASAFQLRLAANFARERGPDAIRIEGRLFAYRIEALAEFQWVSGLVVEDTQLTSYLMTHRLPVRSVFDAVVWVTPAASYADFYKQTYRAFQAAAASGPLYPRRLGEISPAARRALLRSIREDPLGAAAYCSARVVAAAIHLFKPTTFTDRFQASQSTKV